MSASEGKAASKGHETCSNWSCSSRSSRHSMRSSASFAALEARAKAEAARTRAAFAQKEIDMKVKKAQLKVEETRLEATLEAVQQQKEAEAALAEANIYEAAADPAGIGGADGVHNAGLSVAKQAEERTEWYVLDQYDYMTADHHSDDDRAPNPDAQAVYSATAEPMSNENSSLPLKHTPEAVQATHSSRPSQAYIQPKHEGRQGTAQPITERRSNSGASNAPNRSPSNVMDLAKFLARRDLLTAGLTKFNDRPENYWAWKSAFFNATEDLDLKPSEELDLLIKWLGPESAEHVRRLRSVHIRYPTTALTMAWDRLEECYGSSEAIETALFKRLENFPKVSSRDNIRLRELGDLLLEVQSAKEEGYLPGLTYLNTARGIGPILEKLPFSLQEKWMVHGTRYKQQHHVSFPPFSVLCSFIREEARMRNDPSFSNANFSLATPRERFSIKPRGPVMVNRTEVGDSQEKEIAKENSNIKKQCPIHNKPHPLHKCRAFREKSLEDRKAFLRENYICFRCCSTTTHQAKNCKAVIQCTECNSDKHIAALHAGPAPWRRQATGSLEQHGGEEEESLSSATSICTKVCGDGAIGKSCSKICLVDVYPKTQPEKSVKVYAIIDDQSNRSLATSAFFEQFHIVDKSFPYTLSTCTGVSESMGRRARDFVVKSVDGKTVISLPMLIECDQLPDNRAEIPTPAAARHHPHMKSIASKIPALDPKAQIMLLLGRDVIQVHKVLEQRNGPQHAPFAQRLPLGWVIVGEVCLNGAHQPSRVNTLRTNILDNGRPSFMSPCPSKINIKETFSGFHPSSSPAQHQQSKSSSMTCLIGENVFCQSKDDNKLAYSIDDLTFFRIMDKEVFQDGTNSWVAPLPFRSPRQRLPNNFMQARSRLSSLTSALRRNPEKRHHYIAFMKKIFENGHAEIAPPLQPEEECWYLPHFGVYHPRKPGQLRVVFDSSAKHQGTSLNNVLLTGPNMTNSLLGVLMRFRKEVVAVTTDIQQMFHCFIVHHDHRNFLRFLWYRGNNLDDAIEEYRMQVHIFGNSPSPSVATYGLRRAAREGEKEFGAEARQFVERNFYVDDGLVSVPTEEKAIALLQNTQGMLAHSNLHLHKILSNRADVMKAFPSDDLATGLKDLDLNTELPPMQRSLGVSWDVTEDVFTFQIAAEEKPYTRRGVLSTINSLFDPLGVASPVSIQGRHLLRELTSEASEWDTPLPEEKYKEWKQWRDSLHELGQIKLPRQYTPTSLSQAKRRDLFIFCDASTMAIAAVAYLRTTNEDDKVDVGFVFGKAKLAPHPEVTVPKLELCSAVLAVEIAEIITDEMDTRFDTVTYYSDSRVVLGYIHNESRRFYVYVHNRVQRIRRSTVPQQWKYVSTHENPADHGTRSVPAGSLAQTTWLTGPPFLLKLHDSEPLPTSFDLVDPSLDVNIRPLVACHATVTTENLGIKRFERFSTWKSVTRAIARLIHIARSFKKGCIFNGWHSHKGPCSQEDLECAKVIILKNMQQDILEEEVRHIRAGTTLPKQSLLYGLCAYEDESGLLRIGGRLSNAGLKTDEASPIILPGRTHVTTLIIQHHHERVQHQGRHITEGALRVAGLWIIGGKRRISSVLHHCITCRKLRGKMGTQKMSDLPVDRLSTDPPFSFVGLDVFGPWMVAARRTRGGLAQSKRWAVLFTCMSTRAIHIEVIESMDSSSFINALRRFFSIRGPAKQLKSDCGTNFVGACKELGLSSANDYVEVQSCLTDNGCQWIFNPPHSSHMGGSWERLIGLTRRILDVMLSKVSPSKLTHEVLTTFLAEVTAIVNARPLVPVSTDPDSPLVLTPATLLTQKIGVLHPPCGTFDDKDLYGKQWRQVQSLADTFWHRWRTDYLPTLQKRRKWQKDERNLLKGDVVILRDKQVNRNEWPMGVITNTFHSSDGKVRKVEIRTAKDGLCKTFMRPVSETILLLPLKDD